jgi:hypothetical protein
VSFLQEATEETEKLTTPQQAAGYQIEPIKQSQRAAGN